MKLSTCPTPHRFSLLLLAVITVLCLLLCAAEPIDAAASEAGGSAWADDLIYRGKPLKKAGPLYRSPLKERLFSPAVLSRPPGEGAFRYTLFSDFSTGSGMEGSWCHLKDAPWICYIDDGALAFRTRLKAPRTAGTHRYLWTFQRLEAQRQQYDGNTRFSRRNMPVLYASLTAECREAFTADHLWQSSISPQGFLLRHCISHCRIQSWKSNVQASGK